ncbi:MerR family transcriptional regulator [Christensenellaceae bacterium OttesenSCG-928-K19]|nr:MerR family transcriptional regulator [Christensenellaceae bacterium OttesenSCG-928-K19]
MFSIGEFSRLCMVTAKTLRHYDAVGLLTPAYLNEQTGYRYYHAQQLTDMLTIQRLKQYGFSLEEIRDILHAGPKVQAMAMAGKLEEAQAAYDEQGILLKQMEQDIKQLEKGKKIMENKLDVTIVKREPVALISVYETIAIKDFCILFEKVEKKMEETGAECSGAPIAIYHSMEFDPEKTEVELGYPTRTDAAVTRTLAGGTCATAVHKGPYGKLHETYTAIAQWIDKNGYRITNPPYEVYVSDPDNTAENDLITEIYFPVAK